MKIRYYLFAGVFGLGEFRRPWLISCHPRITAYSGIADVLLAFLPWKVVLALQMKRREKIGVAVAMSMGIL
jgi:hypothetical protein